MNQNLILGDCLDKLKDLPDNSIDSIVTDPPASISFMSKDWDSFKSNIHFQDFICEVMTECLRVLKPGGYALVWALPRTSHHTAMGIERAGFEVRDIISHIFGTGFPKNHNIGKKIDEIMGVKRDSIGIVKGMGKQNPEFNGTANGRSENYLKPEYEKTIATSEEAKKFKNYGTSLKPAAENWILVRKPLSEKSIAENCLKWGVGGINIEDCRIKYSETNKPIPQLEQQKLEVNSTKTMYDGQSFNKSETKATIGGSLEGRWPANIILSHSDDCKCIDESWECVNGCPIKSMNEQSGHRKSGDNCVRTKEGFFGEHGGLGKSGDVQKTYGDEGGSSRFFLNLQSDIDLDDITPFIYCSKSSTKERNEGCEELDEKAPQHDFDTKLGVKRSERVHTPKTNNHPTVKSVKLMQYLIRLITPKGGTVLDPFMGSGSTGVATILEDFNFIGIEKEPDYFEISKARITHHQNKHNPPNESEETFEPNALDLL